MGKELEPYFNQTPTPPEADTVPPTPSEGGEEPTARDVDQSDSPDTTSEGSERPPKPELEGETNTSGIQQSKVMKRLLCGSIKLLGTLDSQVQ